MKAVKTSVQKLTKEDLTDFILEYADELPEDERGEFLEVLPGGTDAFTQMEEDDEDADLHERVAEALGALNDINEGRRTLDAEINEDWDDWNGDYEDEYTYSDPREVLPDINDAISLLWTCIDEEAYGDGATLAERISSLKINTDGDYDGDTLHVSDLYRMTVDDDDDFMEEPLEELVKESMYLVYMAGCSDPLKLPEQMYGILKNYEYYDFSLKDLAMYEDEELPGMETFLSAWISYLGSNVDRAAEPLLQDALKMAGDEKALETAAEFVEEHPEIFISILEDGLGTNNRAHNERMADVGKSALQKIPEDYAIRSDAALLASDYELRLDHQDEAEHCWSDAFLSDTTLTGYLRLRLLTGDWNKWKAETEEIFHRAEEMILEESKYGSWSSDPVRKNSLSRKDRCAILFFEEDFDGAIREGLGEKEALGWSYTFMKQGIALFLLLLYRDNGKEALPAGLAAMQSLAISNIEFQKSKLLRGTDKGVNGYEQQAAAAAENEAYFRKLFLQWKQDVAFPEEKAAAWASMLEDLIGKRVDGIMGANRRNYYGECAAFVAAYGEMMESRKAGTKQGIMSDFQAMWSRRTAFRAELRGYGYRG